MLLILFYSLVLVFGYILMFLFIKYNEKIEIYYIACMIFIFILSSLSEITGDGYDYIFIEENYKGVSEWYIIVFVILFIFPAAYLTYPIIMIYKWIFDLLFEFLESVVYLFVPKKVTDEESENAEIVEDSL